MLAWIRPSALVWRARARYCFENRVGLDEAVHAEGCDAQEEQQDHAEADEDFDRDPGVRKEAHASASVSTVGL